MRARFPVCILVATDISILPAFKHSLINFKRVLQSEPSANFKTLFNK